MFGIDDELTPMGVYQDIHILHRYSTKNGFVVTGEHHCISMALSVLESDLYRTYYIVLYDATISKLSFTLIQYREVQLFLNALVDAHVLAT